MGYKYKYIHYDKRDVKIQVSEPLDISRSEIDKIMNTILDDSRCKTSWNIQLLKLSYEGRQSYDKTQQRPGKPGEVVIYGKVNATSAEPFLHEHGWCVWRLRETGPNKWKIIEDAQNGT